MACQFQTLIRPSLSVTTRITRKVEDPLDRHPEETFMSAQPAIVFVHGMYMNGVRWDPWVERAKARGYQSSAPSWPLHDGRPAELRANIPEGLGMLTFGAVVDHLKEIVKGLTTPPILIGHSIGGLRRAGQPQRSTQHADQAGPHRFRAGACAPDGHRRRH